MFKIPDATRFKSHPPDIAGSLHLDDDVIAVSSGATGHKLRFDVCLHESKGHFLLTVPSDRRLQDLNILGTYLKLF